MIACLGSVMGKTAASFIVSTSALCHRAPAAASVGALRAASMIGLRVESLKRPKLDDVGGSTRPSNSGGKKDAAALPYQSGDSGDRDIQLAQVGLDGLEHLGTRLICGPVEKLERQAPRVPGGGQHLLGLGRVVGVGVVRRRRPGDARR